MYKENDRIRFRKYHDILEGKIIYIQEVLYVEYYIVATDYRTYTIEKQDIIEKL